MAILNTVLCYCCGSDVTAPQFFKGRAYGYTCITKVSDQKRVRDSGIWVKPESVEYKIVDADRCQAKAIFTFKNNCKFCFTSYFDPKTYQESGEFAFNLKLSVFNGGLVKFFKSKKQDNGSSGGIWESVIFDDGKLFQRKRSDELVEFA